MKKIVKNKILLCKIINLKFNKDIKFCTEQNENLQVGLINYKINHKIPAHYHPKSKRIIKNTSETLILLSGGIQLALFDNKKIFYKKIRINSPKIILLYGYGHGINILKKNTKIIEIKQGPFLGRKDKIFIK